MRHITEDRGVDLVHLGKTRVHRTQPEMGATSHKEDGSSGATSGK